MAYYKPPKGTRVIDSLTGALIAYADGNTVYEGGGGNYVDDGRGGKTTKPGTVGFEGDAGPSYQSPEQAGGTLSTATKDVFGNQIGNQASSIGNAQAQAGALGATQYNQGNGNFSPAGGTSTDSGSNAPATSGAATGLPPQFQQLYDQLDQYLKRLQENGQVLNPNVQIDPTKVGEFLSQAHNEIDPYYQGQLKIAKDALSSSVGYNTSQEQQYETQAERNYGDNLRTLGEQSADQGFAQSGIRQRKEGDLAYNTNQAIGQNREQLSYNTGNAARSFAQNYGTANLPGFSINAAPTAVSGQSNFSRQAGSLPLYQLSPETYDGLVGSQQYQQTADVANRASQLEGAFRTTQGINQARQLNL